ncbi:MAG: universal stress protein [Xanthobacteraceae bacterium]
MKTILVPIEQNDTLNSVLETTLLLARRFGSYIEGFALRFSLAQMVATDIVSAVPISRLERENDEVEAEARRVFETFMQAHGVPAGEGSGPRYGWVKETPDGDYFVGSRGRVFDVSVLGRPSTDPHGPHISTLESALFESGGPVLIAPPAAPQRMGDNILIAWNGSTEQGRATAFAMPLLQQAKQITVLTVEGGSVPGPLGEDVARWLKRNDIAAMPVTLKPGGRSVGEVILAYAATNGCDLVVKGAYTQSRLRQMIFGGTTRHIMNNATLPVFMAH